jgi:hypothetical protein
LASAVRRAVSLRWAFVLVAHCAGLRMGAVVWAGVSWFGRAARFVARASGQAFGARLGVVRALGWPGRLSAQAVGFFALPSSHRRAMVMGIRWVAGAV